MKKLRILFAILLCAILFQSCTADDLTEETATTVLQHDTITARDGNTPPSPDPETGGDDIIEDPEEED